MRTMSITVLGSPLPPNHAPAGTDKAVAALEDVTYTIQPGDFGFTDPNDNPPNNLLSVQINTLPATGTLRLNGTAVTDRWLLAILENFRGDVPDVLLPYGAPARVSS